MTVQHEGRAQRKGARKGAALCKDKSRRGHDLVVEFVSRRCTSWDAGTREPLGAIDSGLRVAQIYQEHARFVWGALARMGVRPDDLHDVTQDVFIVVHRRLPDREGTSNVRTWLYGICLRVAAGYRRKVHRRREEIMDMALKADWSDGHPDPERMLFAKQAKRWLDEVLGELGAEERRILMMVDFEQLPCHRIADMSNLPLGTVYTRLRSARAAFQAAVRRRHAREETRTNSY